MQIVNRPTRISITRRALIAVACLPFFALTAYATNALRLQVQDPELPAPHVSQADQQKAKARASWAGSGDAAASTAWFPIREKLGATEFLGYETEKAEGGVTCCSLLFQV